MVSVTHATQAHGVDSGDGRLSKNAWNEEHSITGLEAFVESAIDTRTQRISTLAELQAACLAGGNWLVSGTITLGDTVLYPVSNTHIIGLPGAVLQKTTTSGPYRIRAFFDIEDAENVTIEGLDFDHDAARIEHAVIIRGESKNITIRNNILRECHIHVQRLADGVTIKDNRFLGNGVALCGVATGAEISKVDGTQVETNGLVSNVWILDNYIEETLDEAIDINWHTQNVTIRGNTCYNCDQAGSNEVIDVGGDIFTTDANQCRNIIITENVLVNDVSGTTNTVAIHVKGRSTDIQVMDNIIRRGGTVGTTNVGIRIWNTDDTIVRGNCITGYSYGVLSVSAGQAAPQRLVVSDNIIRTYGVDGLQFEGSDHAIIGNDIDGTGSTGHGMHLIGVSKSTVANNRVKDAVQFGYKVVGTSPDLTITGNAARTGASHGFSIDVGADRAIVTGNRAISNTGTGFVFGACDRVVFNNNISRSNGTATSGTGSLTNSLVGTAGNIT